jgi:hypothetical protein
MRDRSAPPADPNRRKIAFKSVTGDDPMDHRIVVPARSSLGDPTPGGTPGGALLELYNTNGTGEKVTVVLPASGWSAIDDLPTPRGYKYRSASSSDAITRIIVRNNLVRVRGGKASWGYTLDEAQQGKIGIRLTMGQSFRWCADMPAKTSGTPPSTASNDRVDKFVGARHTPFPAVCPAVP